MPQENNVTKTGPQSAAKFNLASAGISAASSIGSGLLNQLFARKNAKRQLNSDKELAKFQFDQNLEMWNRQNAYNDPASQMQRYTDAGLNPNMIYGSGTSSAGNSSQIPKYTAPKTPPITPPKLDGMAMLQQYQNMELQRLRFQT